MAIRLYDNDIGNLLIEKEYPQAFYSTDGDICEFQAHIDHPYGKGFYQEIFFENVHIGYGNASLSNRVLLNFESDLETVEMHFTLKGKSTVMTENFPEQVSFDNFQNNIIYANRITGKMEWESKELQFFEINLLPDFFKRFLPEDSAPFNIFRNAIDKRQSCLMNPMHQQMDLQMYNIVNEIMYCNRRGIFKRMFLEAKVIELLLLQLEQSCARDSYHPSIGRTDLEKIYAVKDLILADINSACSLIELAHKVGTNEFTLKKGFKEVFGTTVFGFWNDVKMEQAKKMLLEEDMNVNEVSDHIGYKNAHHFSSAFKRKYGVSPSQMKKRILT